MNLKKNLVKYQRKFLATSLIDDLKFRKLTESKEAINEMLCVILKDKNLKVLECLRQKSEDEPIFHGVVLDCVCKIKTGEIVNVEVQIASDDNSEMRMRYNGSMITVENSPKSKNFKYKDIPKIILIMLCNFDIFGQGKPVYEIERRVKGTKIISDNGQKEIYVNLKASVKDRQVDNLFKILTTIDYGNEKYFPNLTKRKAEIYRLQLGGENNMQGLELEIFNDGRREGKREGKKEGIERGKREGEQKGIERGIVSALKGMVDDGIISMSEAIKRSKMSSTKFRALMSA